MSDKFAVLRKSVDSDWTVVAVWDTWQEAYRDCEERRKNEADEEMLTWEKLDDEKHYYLSKELSEKYFGWMKSEDGRFLWDVMNLADKRKDGEHDG